MDKVGINHQRSPEVRDWIKQEIAAQKERYDKIVKEMEALWPKREKWYRDFFKQIQTVGFHVDRDMRRQIPDKEMPTEPQRKHRVVF